MSLDINSGIDISAFQRSKFALGLHAVGSKVRVVGGPQQPLGVRTGSGTGPPQGEKAPKLSYYRVVVVDLGNNGITDSFQRQGAPFRLVARCGRCPRGRRFALLPDREPDSGSTAGPSMAARCPVLRPLVSWVLLIESYVHAHRCRRRRREKENVRRSDLKVAERAAEESSETLDRRSIRYPVTPFSVLVTAKSCDFVL